MNFESLLSSMETNLERRAFPELKWQLGFYGELVSASGDPTMIERFEKVRNQSQDGIDFENENGSWSLLQLDHPQTIMLKEHGFYKKLFPEDRDLVIREESKV